MLNSRVTTDVLGWTKNAVQMIENSVLLLFFYIDVVKVEPFQLIVHAVVVEAFPNEIESLHDGEKIDLLEIVLGDVVVDEFAGGGDIPLWGVEVVEFLGGVAEGPSQKQKT